MAWVGIDTSNEKRTRCLLKAIQYNGHYHPTSLESKKKKKKKNKAHTQKKIKK